jgi:hypothetical protein
MRKLLETLLKLTEEIGNLNRPILNNQAPDKIYIAQY